MSYDYIIIGSGAGGAAAAWRLASAGSQVLLLEKGNALPRDGSTLDVEQVIRTGHFKSHEPWLDKDGRRFAPEEYFNLGGKTKWYGAALLRYSPREFEADAGHQCLGWPIGYARRPRALGGGREREGARHGQPLRRRRQRAAALEPRQPLAHHLRLVAAGERPAGPTQPGDPRCRRS